MAREKVNWHELQGVEPAHVQLHNARVASWAPVRAALDRGVSVLAILRESVETGDELVIYALRESGALYLGMLGRRDEAAQLAKVLLVLDEARETARASVLAAVDKAMNGGAK